MQADGITCKAIVSACNLESIFETQYAETLFDKSSLNSATTKTKIRNLKTIGEGLNLRGISTWTHRLP